MNRLDYNNYSYNFQRCSRCIHLLRCNDCCSNFCVSCKDIISYCYECNTKYCINCKDVNYCDRCDFTYCVNCRYIYECKNCNLHLCDLCGKTFNKKSLYKWHIEGRKTPCIKNNKKNIMN